MNDAHYEFYVQRVAEQVLSDAVERGDVPDDTFTVKQVDRYRLLDEGTYQKQTVYVMLGTEFGRRVMLSRDARHRLFLD